MLFCFVLKILGFGASTRIQRTAKKRRQQDNGMGLLGQWKNNFKCAPANIEMLKATIQGYLISRRVEVGYK